MAQTPFEPIGNEYPRKNPLPRRKSPLWPILLLVAVVMAGLLGWLLTRDNTHDDDRTSTVITDQRDKQVNDDFRRVVDRDDGSESILTPATDSDDKLTDLNRFVTATDKSEFIGDDATLQKVKVRRVLSDRVFTIGNNNSQELFVILDDNLNNNAIDPAVQIRPGQLLNINGEISQLDIDDIENEQNHGLEINELSELQKQPIYLHAEEISAQQ